MRMAAMADTVVATFCLSRVADKERGTRTAGERVRHLRQRGLEVEPREDVCDRVREYDARVPSVIGRRRTHPLGEETAQPPHCPHTHAGEAQY